MDSSVGGSSVRSSSASIRPSMRGCVVRCGSIVTYGRLVSRGRAICISLLPAPCCAAMGVAVEPIAVAAWLHSRSARYLECPSSVKPRYAGAFFCLSTWSLPWFSQRAPPDQLVDRRIERPRQSCEGDHAPSQGLPVALKVCHRTPAQSCQPSELLLSPTAFIPKPFQSSGKQSLFPS